MSRPCLPTRASCEANLFNDLVKSLVLKWGRRDAGFHHIFLKQRPPCNSARKLSENICLLPLSVLFFRVFDAWKPLLLHHQHIQIRPWAVPNSSSPYRRRWRRRFSPPSSIFSSCQIPLAEFSFLGLPSPEWKNKTAESQKAEIILLKSRLSHGWIGSGSSCMPCGKNCNVT